MYDELEGYRKQALSAAKGLHYGTWTQKKIKEAKTIGEIQRIMITARRKKMDEEEKWSHK